MPLLSLLYNRRRAQIGELELDAVVSEVHTSNASVTSHPVESGADTTDHVQLDPDVIQIDGVISNTPVAFFASFTGDAEERVHNAYQELLTLRNKRVPFSVITSLRTYDDMVITSLEVPKDSGTGDTLRFSMTAQQIRVVEAQIVAAPRPEKSNAEPNKNLGKKPTEEAVPAEKASALVKILKSSGVITGGTVVAP